LATISGSPPTQAAVGKRYLFIPQARDADGDRLSFWIWNRPSWAQLDYRTGSLSGTPAKSDIGRYPDIRIFVTDASWFNRRVALRSFNIDVVAGGNDTSSSAGNKAPTISGTPQRQIVQDQWYVFIPTANDADGDSLTFSIRNKPSWANFHTSTGRLGGTPRSGDAGDYANIVISVSDGRSLVSLPAFAISVVGTASGSATLTWQPPTQRSDGSPLSDLAGYRILWGTTKGSYPNSVKVMNPGIASYVIEDIAPATYYFVITAIDSKGAESGYSNVVSKRIGS
jgi:hypothetical protein